MPDRIDVAFSVDALGPQLTGIGRYSLELARGLRDAGGVGKVSYFRAKHWIPDPEAMLDAGFRVPGGRWRQRVDHWRGRWGARGAIVHGPNYFLPAWADEGVITVHDLSVLLYPETHPVERVKDFEVRFRHSLERSRAIITDSEAVRREVIATLGFAPDRVFSVALGVDAPQASDQADDAILAQLGLERGGYALCVSTFEPRKRIAPLVDAYGQLPQAVRTRYPLVLVGAAGWRNDALNDKIRDAASGGWLKRLDFVPDQTRDALYAGARMFVYPSMYEGFGLPPLEAMAHGVPTIVGDAATLVEVTKGGADIVCVDDTEAFAANLHRLLEDEDRRSALGATGREVAAGYTWSRCVAATVDVYRRS